MIEGAHNDSTTRPESRTKLDECSSGKGQAPGRHSKMTNPSDRQTNPARRRAALWRQVGTIRRHRTPDRPLRVRRWELWNRHGRRDRRPASQPPASVLVFLRSRWACRVRVSAGLSVSIVRDRGEI